MAVGVAGPNAHTTSADFACTGGLDAVALLFCAENAMGNTDVMFVTKHLISPTLSPALPNNLTGEPLTVSDHYSSLLAPFLCSFDGRRDIAWRLQRPENAEVF